MTMYFLPDHPATPVPLPRIRALARRVGYRLQTDRFRSATFSLFDEKIGAPIAGLDHVGLGEIVHALDQAHAEVRATEKRRIERRRKRRLARKAKLEHVQVFDNLTGQYVTWK